MNRPEQNPGGGSVRFAFTDDQLAFRDAVRELLANECPPVGRARRVVERDAGAAERVWAQLGEMGVLGVLAGESVGGLGLTDLDLVLILEETGLRRAARADRRARRGRRAAPRRRRSRRRRGRGGGRDHGHDRARQPGPVGVRRRRRRSCSIERSDGVHAVAARRRRPRAPAATRSTGRAGCSRSTAPGSAPGSRRSSPGARARRWPSTAARSAPRRSSSGWPGACST